jgi:carbamoyltransferase
LSNFILGLNTTGFNTASCLIKDGRLISGIEEERIIREKRTRKFPIAGIKWNLLNSKILIDELDAIAIGWNPAINLEAYSLAQSERLRFLGEIFYNVPNHLFRLTKNKAGEISEQQIELSNGSKLKIIYIKHHLCHASNYFVSPFDEAAIMTVDAFGEANSTTFSIGKKNKINNIWQQDFPHSLGGFYSAFTEFLGFEAQSDEWKLMGASSYGNPKKYLEKIRKLIYLNNDGFELDLAYFNFYQFHRPGRFTPKLSKFLGIKPNGAGMPLKDYYFDLAASVQAVFEDVYIHLLRLLKIKTKLNNLVISGGSALNCVANGKILSNTGFKEVFIPPFPDDSGCSIGAAFYVHNQLMNKKKNYILKSNYLGPIYSDLEIEKILIEYKIKYKKSKNITKDVANLISNGKIIGWFQGNLEFGDRALGNRSILADPRNFSMKDKVNKTVKYREEFRPFAPAILSEYADKYFEKSNYTPFMEKTYLIKKNQRKKIPAVVHVDGTGRLQTVSKDVNSTFYDLISEFKKITKIPILLNTSFNIKGEPIVCSPVDAIRTFFSSGLDCLALGSFLIKKNENNNN